jgi:hypothetical protein
LDHRELAVVQYGSLAALVTAAYVGIAVGVGSMIGSSGGSNLALSLLATAVVPLDLMVAVGSSVRDSGVAMDARDLPLSRTSTGNPKLDSVPTKPLARWRGNYHSARNSRIRSSASQFSYLVRDHPRSSTSVR